MVDLKKAILFLLTFFSISINAFACGEIKSIAVDDAVVKSMDDTSYLVTLKQPKDKVMLNVSSDYDFIKEYGPREVSTKEDAIIKVDGHKCGFGIYLYTVSFNVSSKAIAENTENENNQVQTKAQKGLQNIEIEGYTIEFSPLKFNYSIEVPESVNSLNIKTTKINEDDIVSISSNAYYLDDNPILITVSNKNGNYTYYEISIVRGSNISNNTFLGSIDITGYSINFDPVITEYSLTIPSNVRFLDITAKPEQSISKVTIDGNSNLKNGSIITITVTANNESKKEYFIKIVKEVNIIDTISEYKIYIIIVALIILLVILLILNQKKKKNKKEEGPKTIDTPITTAGEVKTFTAPVEEAKPVDSQNIKLDIIKPTDIEVQEDTQNSSETPVEIFKL